MGRLNHIKFATEIALLGALAATSAFAQDRLPSWNEGAAKQAILDFVAATTKKDGPGFVPPTERIAVFDNDGTLWSEQPIYFQFAFAIDRVKALAAQHPEWKEQEPFSFVLKGDVKGLAASGEKGLLEIIGATHAGMTTDEFEQTVKEWMATARHPRFQRPYNELVFQPMLELLAYLRASGFKTYIVSGGGVEFMRPWALKTYGIPPEQVIGSSGKLKYELRGDKPVLVKLPEVNFIDDKAGKPVGIEQFIGRRPIAAFGNSDGDYEMLRWTTANAAPGQLRFGLIVHHTDADREWAYDRESHVGQLKTALDEAPGRNWTVVDMRRDWKRIYPFDSTSSGASPDKSVLTGDWKLIQLGDAAAPPGYEPITLSVTADGKVAGSTGVNRFFGGLAMNGKLFGPLGMTRKAGPPAAMEAEAAYAKALAEVTTFTVADGKLTLLAGEKSRLVFERMQAADKK